MSYVLGHMLSCVDSPRVLSEASSDSGQLTSFISVFDCGISLSTNDEKAHKYLSISSFTPSYIAMTHFSGEYYVKLLLQE